MIFKDLCVHPIVVTGKLPWHGSIDKPITTYIFSILNSDLLICKKI